MSLFEFYYYEKWPLFFEAVSGINTEYKHMEPLQKENRKQRGQSVKRMTTVLATEKYNIINKSCQKTTQLAGRTPLKT